MELPAHVQTAIGVGSPITEDELVAASDGSPFVKTVFGLSGQEFATAAKKAVANPTNIVVSQPARISSWKFLELTQNGTSEGWAVSTCEAATLVATFPPTAIGQALVVGWFSEPKLIDDTNKVVTGRLVQGVAPGSSLSAFASKLALEWIDVCFFLERSTCPPPWVSKSQINIRANARLIRAASNLKYEDLFLEAVSESKSKWRFLSLYRILEHGYLSEVYQTLERNFYLSPEESLSDALKLVKSEVKQFISLAQNASLETGFKAFFDAFETAKAGNQFANAIARSIQTTGQQNQVTGDWQMGVLIFYKIRCAIVHAGLSGPIFDAYPDRINLLDKLLPNCESIVLTFLGVEII